MNTGYKKGIFWGIVLVLGAVLLIVDEVFGSLGLFYNIPVPDILLGVLLLAWAVNELIKRRIAHIFFPLAFIFILFEEELASLCGVAGRNLINNFVVLVAALMFTIGVSILTKRFAKPMVFAENGNHSPHKFMGSSTRFIDSTVFQNEYIENNMGSTQVYFENIDAYGGGGTLRVENNMGSAVLYIPSHWKIVMNIENNMGSVKCPSSGNAEGKIINVVGENNMGSVVVELV